MKQLEKTDRFDTALTYIFRLQNAEAPIVKLTLYYSLEGRTAGYTWTDYETNSHIAKELEITPVLDKLLEYKRNWIQHVNRCLVTDYPG